MAGGSDRSSTKRGGEWCPDSRSAADSPHPFQPEMTPAQYVAGEAAAVVPLVRSVIERRRAGSAEIHFSAGEGDILPAAVAMLAERRKTIERHGANPFANQFPSVTESSRSFGPHPWTPRGNATPFGVRNYESGRYRTRTPV